MDVHEGTHRASYDSLPTPDQGIGCVLSGRYASEVFRAGRWQRSIYEPGDICFHQRGETLKRRFEVNSPQSFHTALVYVPLIQIEAAYDHYRRAGQPTAAKALQPKVRDLAIAHVTGSLVRAMSQGVTDLYAESTATWIAAHLATHHSSGGAVDRREAGVITDARLKRVMDVISTRFAEPLTLEELASEACISKFHFARLFHEKTGMAPHAYLTQHRLEKACQLLRETDVSISNVGSTCGYTSAAHFSKSFSLRYTIAPLAFRRQSRGSR